jgi:hypothetical protein
MKRDFCGEAISRMCAIEPEIGLVVATNIYFFASLGSSSPHAERLMWLQGVAPLSNASGEKSLV